MRPLALLPDAKTLRTIENLARIQCTQAEAGAVLGVERRTLCRFFARHPEAREKWELGLESGKASLRRNQFKLSETNATMAIWLGKMYLGQREPRFEGDEAPLGKKEMQHRAALTAGQDSEWGDDLKPPDWQH
jgi:hypothetical protein